MKPISVVSFLALVFLLLFVIMLIMPANGLRFNEKYSLSFPSLAEFLIPDTTSKTDISFIFEENEEDENQEEESGHSTEANERRLVRLAKLDSLKKEQMKLQYPDGNKTMLHNFFRKLSSASSENNSVRITHYGDSQIESDRITGYIRNELQKRFGGDGPGLFPVIPIAPKFWAKNSYSSNWTRYAGFGKTDSSVNHNKYGALLNFSRFSPIQETSLHDTAFYRAWFNIEHSRNSYGKAGVFRELTLFYTNCTKPTLLSVFNGNELYWKDTLDPTNSLGYLKIPFENPASSIKLSFKTKASPDILGLSINSQAGVICDNIPLRGASGTEFSKVDRQLFTRMLQLINPDLLILQFGGNVIPYVNDEETAVNYGKWLQTHIQMLKNMLPGTQVIVIGPADMSVKEGNKYVTHPYLSKVRDAVKNAALNSGCAFWDMYEAMGGKNSMPQWVNSDPSLGASDYIHFSSKGANKIAQLFFEALIKDYKQWNSLKKNQNEKMADLH